MFTVNPVTAASDGGSAGAVRAARLAVKQPRIARPSAAVSEYPAQLPQSEAVEGLKDIAPILALLSARLQQRESRYAVLFDLLLKLANTAIDSDKVAEKIADEARDDTPQALDAVWEEEQVKFFADKGCGDSAITAHQRRFAGAVAPQYLNITTGGQH